MESMLIIVAFIRKKSNNETNNVIKIACSLCVYTRYVIWTYFNHKMKYK